MTEVRGAALAVATYGERNHNAPSELDAFAFLIGKSEGVGKTKTPDGKDVTFAVTWIGRYILDGMAIADEFHSVAPDGSPYLGISRPMRRNIPLAIFTALCVSACVESPPEIGRGLPRNFQQARPYFDQRVKERFPVGSDETRFLAELRREHFAIGQAGDPSRYAHSASYEAHQIACKTRWVISWSAADGRIQQIAGDYGAVCL